MKKPWRLWLLQAQAALPLIGATLIIPWMQWQRGIDLYWGIWIVNALLGIVLPVLVILSLQRLTPRPSIVAPIVGFAYWGYVTYRDYVTFGHRDAGPLERYKFQEVDPGAQLASAILGRGFWLVLVLSLIFHARTRDYLAGRIKQVPPETE